MKRYQFKLEPLLVKRQTLEDQCQQEMAEQNRLLRQHQEELKTAFEEYRNHRLAADAVTISIAELEIFNNYANVLLDRIEAAKTKLREQRKAVDAVKDKLLALHRDTQAVEKLKEKDKQAYLKDANREESKQIDEYSVIRHAGEMSRKRQAG